jgi:hypothetical protein
MVFDHLNLDEVSRTLMTQACNGSEQVRLAPLDKGLSGSAVWLARWNLKSGTQSKFHVFKVGSRAKLQREYDAMDRIAASIQAGFPHFAIFQEGDVALLRQEFAGSGMDSTRSLRQHMLSSEDSARAAQLVRDLYFTAMNSWYHGGAPTTQTMGSVLDWWVTRLDLAKGAEDVGRQALDASLYGLYSTTVADLSTAIDGLISREETVVECPVHGDLHSQNILVDTNGQLHVIDYGWTAERWGAIDFLMLECSLKFVASPPHARLEDLLRLDAFVDKHWRSEEVDLDELARAILGKHLATVAAAIMQVRRCAFEHKAAADFDQYRRGLAVLTAALATLPTLLNRVFLFHSLAYQIENVV